MSTRRLPTRGDPLLAFLVPRGQKLHAPESVAQRRDVPAMRTGLRSLQHARGLRARATPSAVRLLLMVGRALAAEHVARMRGGPASARQRNL